MSSPSIAYGADLPLFLNEVRDSKSSRSDDILWEAPLSGIPISGLSFVMFCMSEYECFADTRIVLSAMLWFTGGIVKVTYGEDTPSGSCVCQGDCRDEMSEDSGMVGLLGKPV